MENERGEGVKRVLKLHNYGHWHQKEQPACSLFLFVLKGLLRPIS
jgi:hypothetical protein